MEAYQAERQIDYSHIAQLVANVAHFFNPITAIFPVGGLTMNVEQQAKLWGQIVTKSSRDERFRKQLLADPAAAVKEAGLELPPGVKLRVVENTDTLLHVAIPPLESDKELSEEELQVVAGGRLAPGLVSGLAKVFGWNSGQIGQILDAQEPAGDDDVIQLKPFPS